jgi:AmmeMemoRadiSam system protein B
VLQSDANKSARGIRVYQTAGLPAASLDSLHRFESVGYATSAEVTGDASRVVGYAGVLLG